MNRAGSIAITITRETAQFAGTTLFIFAVIMAAAGIPFPF